MIWFATFLAFCIFFGSLNGGPIRQFLLLSLAIGYGVIEGWAASSFGHGYEVFLWIICVGGFLLSPVLWACFGVGAYVGKNGFTLPWKL